MTPAERFLRNFLDMDDKAPLSPITRQLIDTYLNIPGNAAAELGKSLEKGILKVAETKMMNPEYAYNIHEILTKRKNATSILQDQIFLFAAGSQLAYNTMSPEDRKTLETSGAKGVYEAEPVRPFTASGPASTYIYTSDIDTHHPNAAVITLGAALLYAYHYLSGNHPQATQAESDGFRTSVRNAIHAGAEETLHVIQQKDPAKKAELDRQNILAYGQDHIRERIIRMQTALSQGPQAREAFAKQDPAEIDVEKSLDKIKHRITGLALKILAPKVQI